MTDSYDGILHWIQQADHDTQIDPAGNKDAFVSAIENYWKLRFGLVITSIDPILPHTKEE